MKKILFLISVAVISLFAIAVNAEELKPIDEHALDNLQTTFNIDKKESELNFSGEDYYYFKDVEPVIKKAIEETLKENGYEAPDFTKIDIEEVGREYADTTDIHKSKITVKTSNDYETNKTIVEKTVNIKFKNTDDYNESDKAYVENKLKEIKSSKVPSWVDLPAPKRIPPIVITEDYDDFDIKTLIDDKNMEIKAYVGGCGNQYSTCMVISALKNDVVYVNTMTYLVKVDAQTLDNGLQVAINEITEEDALDSEIYKQMLDEVKKTSDTKNILGCYELEALGETYKGMEISFDIDEKYNGRIVKIFHRKKSGVFETFEVPVVNGKVTIKVDEFSPFMIVLTDKKVETNTTTVTTNKVESAPNNAQTSSMNVGLYSILALGSLIGIAYIVKKKIA